ncbi:MAG: sulfotransferase [Planctomycetota bacterium]
MARPLFVVSAPRSGSTWVVALLGSHPQIRMVNELGWVPFLRRTCLLASTPAGRWIDDGEGFRTPGILTERHAESFARSWQAGVRPFVDDLYRRIAGDGAGSAFFGDKLVSVADLAFALEQFPEAAFVHLVRDPRDAIASAYAFASKQPMPWDGASFDVRVGFMERFLREAGARLQGREHFVVRYEDLVADVPGRLRAMLAFLGLDLTPEVDAFRRGAAAELFARHGTSDTAAASIGRWRRDLTAPQQALANTVLREQLQRFGYPA